MVRALFKKRLSERAAILSLAEELDYNASELGNEDVPVEQYKELRFSAWRDQMEQIQTRLRPDPGLLRQVTTIYEDLARMQCGQEKPKQARLYAAATELRATVQR